MTLLAALLSIGEKMAEQQGKREGGDFEFIGVFAYNHNLCNILSDICQKNRLSHRN